MDISTLKKPFILMGMTIAVAMNGLEKHGGNTEKKL